MFRGMAAVALWTVAGSLMVTGTIWHRIELMAWGGFVALTACCVTGWIIAECATRKERIRVDAVVQAVVDRLLEEDGRMSAGVSRLHDD